MPHAPDESSLFLRTVATPSIFPVDVRIPGQDAPPLGPTEIHWYVGSAEPVAGQLGRELKERDSLGPGVPIWIEVE